MFRKLDSAWRQSRGIHLSWRNPGSSSAAKSRAIRRLRGSSLVVAFMVLMALGSSAQAQTYAQNLVRDSLTSGSFTLGSVNATITVTDTDPTCSSGGGLTQFVEGGKMTGFHSLPGPPSAQFFETNINQVNCTDTTRLYRLVITFDQPVTDPRMHFINLDSSSLDFAATPNLVMIRQSGNPVFETTATQVNPNRAFPRELNCEMPDGFNPSGRCGTVIFDGTYTQIIADTYELYPDFGLGDGFWWTMSLEPPPPTFGTCSSTVYLSQANPTALRTVSTATNPFTESQLSAAAVVLYGAAGFNPDPLDRYIYAVRYNDVDQKNLLLRIGSDGSREELGYVTGLPDLYFDAGEIGSDGIFYVKPAGGGNTLYRIDLTTRAATPLTLNQFFAVDDLAWHDGRLYGHSTVTDRLYVIDPSTSPASVTDFPVGVSNQGFPAMYGASNGVFGLDRLSGRFYKFDTTTGAATLLANTTASGSPQWVDGVKCANSPLELPADLAIAKTSGSASYTPGGDVVYTIDVSNNGPFPVQSALVNDPLPTGFSTATASWSCGNALAGASCGLATGSGPIVDAPVHLPAGGRVTFTLTLPVPASFSGDLSNTATVDGPTGSSDPNMSNNSSTLVLSEVAYAISGTVFEDIAGDLLNGRTVGDINHNPGIAGRTVRLFDSSGAPFGTPPQTTMTDSNGFYSFTGLAVGIYYVTVDAPDATAVGVTGVLGEQTYASAGSGNDPSNPSGFGSLCVSAEPDYMQRDNPVTGYPATDLGDVACYGGRRGAAPDDGVSNVLDNAEHVVRVAVGGADITGVDFGFSFNVVTNVEASGQGSVAQFVTNANAIAGSSLMRFVPAVGANAAGGTSTWWQRLDTGILYLTDSRTTLDGSAHSNADGATLLDTNPEMLGTVGMVGLDGTLSQLPGPELELRSDIVIGSPTVSPGDTTIRDLAINARIAVIQGGSILVEGNVFASLPHVFPSGDPLPGRVGLGPLDTVPVATGQAVRVFTIRNNLMSGFDPDQSVPIRFYHTEAAIDVVIEKNEIRGTVANGIEIYNGDGIQGTSVIQENLIVGARHAGIYDHDSQYARTAPQTLRIENNTITQMTGSLARSGIVVETTAAGGPYTITRNRIIDNGVAAQATTMGIVLGAQAKGIRISQNQFGGNSGNAIDLGDNGVSGNNPDGCTAAGTGGANNDLARPVISSAVRSSTTLTVAGTICDDTSTYELEIYEAVAGDGDGSPAAGEGVTYLGRLAGLTIGTFNDSITLPTSASNPASITAILIRTATSTDGQVGDTSEFSENFAVVSMTISGTVFEDQDSELLADGGIGANNPGIIGRTVRLFDSSGAPVGTTPQTTTDINGTYSFDVASAGTYYVTVDAPDTTAAGVTGVLGEQTYASAGIDNDPSNPSGFGGLCVSAEPDYTQRENPVTGNIANDPANVACYGGRRGDDADNAANTGALADAEHVIRVAVGSAGGVTGVDFGFSFNVVTNVEPTGQGSVAQFVTNANAITGSNLMRFVPAVEPNRTEGLSRWWKSTVGSLWLLDDGTEVNGQAYSNIDGADVLDTNPEMLGTGGPVGVDAWPLQKVPGPELELMLLDSLKIGSSGVLSSGPPSRVTENTTIRNVAFTVGTPDLEIRPEGVRGFVMEWVVLGSEPHDFPGNTTSGVRIVPTFGTSVTDPALHFLSGIAIRNSLFGRGSQFFFFNSEVPLTDLVIEENEMVHDRGASGQGAIHLDAEGGVSGTSVIQRNRITNPTAGSGILYFHWGNGPPQQLRIENNTIEGVMGTPANGSGWQDGIHIAGADVSSGGAITITRNVIRNNGQQLNSGETVAGVSVNYAARGIRISQNHFGGNFGNAIDLNDNGVSGNSPDPCKAAGTNSANNDLARPVISSAVLNGANVDVRGTYCSTGTYIIELYAALANGDGDGDPPAGEGVAFIKDLTGQTGGIFSTSVPLASVTTGALTALVINESTNDTSEFSANAAVSILLTGKVIQDDGAGSGSGGVAHNAAQDGTETGRSGVTVSLTDCASTVHVSSDHPTDVDGVFSLNLAGVPVGAVCLEKTRNDDYVAVSANPGTISGSTYTQATDRLAFTLAANTSYSDIVLGEVPASELTADNVGLVRPGESTRYAHTFVAGTSANVSFTSENAPTQNGWTSVLYIDSTCDQHLDTSPGGDTQVSNPVPMTQNQTICLLNLVTSPPGAPEDASIVTTVRASEELTPMPAPGTGPVIVPHARTDTTTIGQSLELTKEVRTVTSACPADATASQADPEPFAASNMVEPGQAIEYRINYRNNTSDPVTNLQITDVVTIEMQFRTAYCHDSTTPMAGIAGCGVTSTPTATDKSIVWVLTDATPTPTEPAVGLQPGARGSVGFCVEIAP